MPRYKLFIEYDGRPFCGWQRQIDLPTVQGSIETAIFKFSGETVTLGVAGRTDTGVHATGQVAHVDMVRDWTPERLREAVNFHLRPWPVTLLDVICAPDDFNARFSAKGRHYRYNIVNRRAPLTLSMGLAMHVRHPLDTDLMHKAAQQLIGTFDFTTFRHTHCQAKSPVKTLDRLDVTRTDDKVYIHASSRSFLHNQVRSLAGALVSVGDGRWSPTDLKSALEAKDRKRCAPVAPSDGLYLYQVDY